MSKFDEFVSGLTPETFQDPTFDLDVFRNGLQSAYREDLSVPDAKIAQQAEQLAQVSQELRDQKVKNYDLLGKIPADNNPAPPVQERSDEDVQISDFFGTKGE